MNKKKKPKMEQAHRRADRALSKKELEINRYYKNRVRTIRNLLEDFYKNHKTDFDKKLDEYNSGKISKSEYSQYMMNNTILSNEWRTIADKIADTLSAINKGALNNIVNKGLKEIYIENYNSIIRSIGGELLEN